MDGGRAPRAGHNVLARPTPARPRCVVLAKTPFFARRRALSKVDEAQRRLDAGDEAAAWQALEAALADDPGCAPAEFLLGRIANDRKQHDVAARHLERAVELAPGNADAYGELGRAFHELRSRAKAEEAYTRSLELRDDPYTAINLATLLRDSGRFEEATRIYARAAKTPGLDAETRTRIERML